MKEVSITEVKKIQLDILKYVDQICKKYNIKYSLYAGTLLGAIRHKGFIPWDDDIDIMLIRPEYERLLECLKLEDKYLLLTPTTPGYCNMFAKLVDCKTIIKHNNVTKSKIIDYGVNIDIFPIDGVPDCYQEQVYFHNTIISMMNEVYKLAGYTEKNTENPQLEKCKVDLLNKLKTYNFNKCTHSGFLVSSYGVKEILPKQFFEELIEVEFENETFLAIKEYKLFLTSLYGNYTELPPIEDQRSPHQYKAYRLEKK